MATKVIGVDVGTSAVRAVELELSDPPVVRRIGQVGLPAGAMQDGEVVDVAAVTLSLRRLWETVGFTSRTVRVGLASARMIIRVIEMPRLSNDELISAIRLQLEDFVPLPADETVFDIQPLDQGDAAKAPKKSKKGAKHAYAPQQLLLAAAHRNALLPLMDAVRGAGLKVEAVDVVPAALARALTTVADDTDEVDLIVSIGAGTVVVVAARQGSPVFARTLTNISGRRVTERIASRLDLSDVEAEKRKRWDVDDVAEALEARDAAEPSVDELVDEVRDSIAYYAGQEGARPVRRLVLTGGGAQLTELADVLSDRLGLPVEHADPFAGMKIGDIGFAPEDLPFLTPYAAAAVGVALAGGSSKAKRLDLTPSSKEQSTRQGLKPLLTVGGGVLAVAAVGAFYMQRSSAIDEEQTNVDTLTAQLIDTQTQIDGLLSTGGPGAAGVQVTSQAVVESVAPRDVDWLAASTQLKGLGAPLGVSVSTLLGSVEPYVDLSVVIDPAAVPAASAAQEVDNGPDHIGRYSITATSADLNTIAAWLDAVDADEFFDDPWVAGISRATLLDGTGVMQFTAEVFVTDRALVERAYSQTDTKESA